jgi:hypothetical protein
MADIHTNGTMANNHLYGTMVDNKPTYRMGQWGNRGDGVASGTGGQSWGRCSWCSRLSGPATNVINMSMNV